MVSFQVAAGPSAPVGPPLSLLPRPLVHVVGQQAPTREGSVPRARGLLNDGAHHHLPRHGGLCHGLPLAYRRGREDREGHHHREEAPLHSASSTAFHFFPKVALSLSPSLSVARFWEEEGARTLGCSQRTSDHDHSPDLGTRARPPRGSSRLSSRAQLPFILLFGSEEPHRLVQKNLGWGDDRYTHSVFYFQRHPKFRPWQTPRKR